MNPEEETRENAGEPEASSTAPPPEPVDRPAEQVRAALSSAVHRRTFLAAAALGTAAAALVNRVGDGFGGISLGPLPAFANDLSEKPCTAQDVEIIGPGVVLNEPCSATAGSTFNATVQFVVQNNTSSGRYCIALHLAPNASLGNGFTGSVDLVLRDSSGSSTAPGKSNNESFHRTTMTGVLSGFPTTAGLACFGSPGVTTGKCAANTCTTISWNTSNTQAGCTAADQNPPGGQCRHQQVCVVGFGASLSCTTNCTPSCGGVSTLVACVSANDGSSGGTNQAPITYTLVGSDGSTATGTIASLTSFTACVTQAVTVTATTSYTVTFKDRFNCARTATTTLSATPLATPTITATGPNCSGVVTLVASSSGATSFTFSEGTATYPNTSGTATITFTPTSTAQTHVVTVVAANAGGCSATNSATVSLNAAVALTVSQSNDCAGNVTLTATPTGGNGTYTVVWSDNGGTASTGTSFTIAGPSQGGTATHTVVVTATDSTSNRCSASGTGTFTTTLACATVTTAVFA
jgi:hypothetical protein